MSPNQRNRKRKAPQKPSAWQMAFIFIVTGVFIGLILTLQIKSSIPSTVHISDELKAQKELVDSYISEQGLLKTKIVSLRTEIEAAQENANNLVEMNNLDTLKSLKREMGLETVRGPGIEILLNDGVFVNRESAGAISQSLIHASDLRDIVNALRTADAEAISINDQRIIASTPITSVGNTILVNNFHLLPPFSIKAVGDTGLIMQRLNDESVIPDIKKRVKELKIQYGASIKKGILVPIYNGNLATKFINNEEDQKT